MPTRRATVVLTAEQVQALETLVDLAIARRSDQITDVDDSLISLRQKVALARDELDR